MKVLGKNVVAYINDGGWKLYACGTSIVVTVTTDVIETSVAGQGKFATFAPTKNAWTAILEGVTSLEETDKLSLPDLRARQISQTLLFIKFQRTAGNATYTEQGYCIITSSEDTGSYDNMNTFSVGLQGTGPLVPNPTDSISVPFTYYYGLSTLDTVTVPGFADTFPSEADFISSVDDVFTSGTEKTGTELKTGDNVTVQFTTDTYGSGDYVRFLQMPATEQPFTKWSEESNPFQQNQPIDPSFNVLSGNVWFKSERDGQTLYMTYSQTFFTGAITFSR